MVRLSTLGLILIIMTNPACALLFAEEGDGPLGLGGITGGGSSGGGGGGDFNEYISRFQDRSRSVNKPTEVSVPISFDNLNGPAGVCVRSGGSSAIYVDRGIWGRLGDYSREALIFHELGHCVLGRGHRTDKSGARPVSIMYPVLLNARYYEQNYWDYVNELFDNANTVFAGGEGEHFDGLADSGQEEEPEDITYVCNLGDLDEEN